MNKIEKHIQTNREKFDSFEPSADHMSRFRNKLVPVRVSLYSRVPYGLKIAAVLLLVAVSSILIYEQAQRYYISRQQPIEERLPEEYFDAKVYYTALINERYTEIDQLSGSDPERKEMLSEEMAEMDRLFQSIIKDLQTAPTDERILSTLITHYQMKLDIMEQIIKQLEEVNKINSTYKSHENTEV
ncbi:hypothetical protein ACFLSP_00590 [Bacteroidota bacterium]